MPRRIEKTVFISYRRTNSPWALAIYQNLTHHGYDVFFDYESIKSGDFGQVIIENIKSSAHFLVLLTPSALERCNEPGDWLRYEIETAIYERRNIVPLFLDGFDFGDPYMSQFLTDGLVNLKRYNGLTVHSGYFEAAMQKLRKFLEVPLDAVLHPRSHRGIEASQYQQAAARNAAKVMRPELEAQKWFEKANKTQNLDDKIQIYTHALALKPDYAYAYNNRGYAKYQKGEISAAMDDYEMAIAYDQFFGQAYNNLGLAYYALGNYERAIENYNLAINNKLTGLYVSYANLGAALREIGEYHRAIQAYSAAISNNRKYTSAYLGRAITWWLTGDARSAFMDLDQAIQIDKRNPSAFFHRGRFFYELQSFNQSIVDYTSSIELDPNIPNTYYNRALSYIEVGSYLFAIDDLKKCLSLGGGVQDGKREQIEHLINDLIEQLEN